MNKPNLLALTLMLAVALLGACRKNVREDYDGARSRAEDAHRALDSQKD